MVKIPTIQADEPYDITARPREAGRVGRSLQYLGHEGQRLAVTIAQQAGELRRRKKALDMALTLSEVGVDLKTGAKDIALSLQKKPNSETHVGFAEIEFDEMAAERLSFITDPETLARAKVDANQIKTNFLINEKNFADRLFHQEYLGGVERTLAKLAVERDYEGGVKLIDAGMEDGGIDPLTGERLKISHREEVNLAEVRAGINLDPSKGNVDRLLKEFPVPPMHEVRFRERAEMLREKRKVSEADAKINAAYRELTEKYGTKYGLMLQKTGDPQWQREHGLGLKETSRLEGYIRGKEADMDLQYRGIQEDFLQKLEKGTLTREEVMNSILPATRFMQGDKDWFLDEIRKRELRPYEVSNPEVYGRVLMDVVLHPENWSKDDIWGYMGRVDDKGNLRGLSPGDAGRIWGIWEGMKSTDPVIAKKYGDTAQGLARIEEYRKMRLFVEPEGDELTTAEVVLNDQKAHLVQKQFLFEVLEQKKDPFETLNKIMQGYVDQRTAWFFERWFKGAKDLVGLGLHRWPGKEPRATLPEGRKQAVVRIIENLREENTPADEIREMLVEAGYNPKDFEAHITRD